MVITKDLGAVSAYAYAVEQGYQGTEEEFAELMARQATVAEEAAASADAAAESASEAQASAEQAEQSAQSISGDVERAEQAATTATGKATEAATSATTANGAAQTATGKASEASASATAAANSATAAAQSATNAAASATAAQTAQTAAETAQGKAEDAQAAAEAAAASIDPDTLVKKTELEDYAKIDGSYETMTVGNAEQLVATVGVDDSTPYTFRTSGGSVDIGDRETVNAVVGGTVAWNQLAGNFTARSETLGVTIDVDNAAGTIHAYGTPTATNNLYFINNRSIQVNHVYYFRGAVVNNNGNYLKISVSNSMPIQNDTGSGSVFKPISGTDLTFQMSFGFVDSQAVDVTWRPQIFDLTAMFGSTIADYIYALERSTAGAGVAYFRKLFPKDYYEYNAGELLSVNTSQHKMVGFNAYDNSTGKAKVVGGNQYEITGAYTSLSLDGETITPVSGKFTPSVSGELTVTGGGSNTCIHLVWDGERDGEYEPYKKWSYPLDSSLTLRGIPKLDASGNLYYDGDTYESDGAVTRKYGVVDLGTLNWAYVSESAFNMRTTTSIDALLPEGPTIAPNAISSIYPVLPYVEVAGTGKSLTIVFATSGTAGRVWVNDSSYSDAAAFKAAMSGVMLVYELAEPTTETAEPYTQIQSVDDFGTEEYTDYAYENGDRDVAIPVGHNTVYSPNLRAKLEMSPNSPDGDGLYVVEQSNGQNEYVPLVIPTELPTAPSEDGTYTLKITVSGGTVTKSWIAEE